MQYRAVVFDLGGVVLDSPLAVIAAYERERGIEPGLVNRVVGETGPDGAWGRHERGEIDRRTFSADFARECQARGAIVDPAGLLRRIEAATRVRPEMVTTIDRLRVAGYRVAALTNNWVGHRRPRGLDERFDVIVESARVGYNKPDPRIYLLTLRELGVTAQQAVFLDDIGRNLKVARRLGMTTIKVDGTGPAIAHLGRVLDIDLSGHSEIA